ncbi:MAG: hypothetical protein IJ555_04325 [Ruminococcus sp.]|nr:hypothetical protein [Ruminococcus sp.]
MGIGIDQYFSIEDDSSGKRNYKFYNKDMHICPLFPELPDELLNYLINNFGVRIGRLKTGKANCIENHCSNCSSLQDNSFIFNEEGPPFFITEPEDLKELTVLKYKLPYDIACAPGIKISPTDDMIKRYADIKQLKLK